MPIVLLTKISTTKIILISYYYNVNYFFAACSTLSAQAFTNVLQEEMEKKLSIYAQQMREKYERFYTITHKNTPVSQQNNIKQCRALLLERYNRAEHQNYTYKPRLPKVNANGVSPGACVGRRRLPVSEWGETVASFQASLPVFASQCLCPARPPQEECVRLCAPTDMSFGSATKEAAPAAPTAAGTAGLVRRCHTRNQ